MEVFRVNQKSKAVMTIQAASMLGLGCHVLKAHPLHQSIDYISILGGQSEDSSLTGSLLFQCALINVLICRLCGETQLCLWAT